jgi:hypothetical protein
MSKAKAKMLRKRENRERRAKKALDKEFAILREAAE